VGIKLCTWQTEWTGCETTVRHLSVVDVTVIVIVIVIVIVTVE